MKKKMILLLIVMLALVLGGIVVLNKFPGKMIVPKKIVEIAINKEEVLENLQKMDASGIPDYIIKRFDGKQEVLAEYLDNTLDDVEALLTEIRTALVEGRVKIKYNKYMASYVGRLETPSEKISIYMIKEDGSFRQCEKISYSNGNVQGQEEVVFWDDNRTLKRYEGPVGQVVYFEQDGNLELFSAVVDGKCHSIGWNAAGKIDFYRVSDAQSQRSETEEN